MPVNFQPLFTTSRVVVASYRTLSTMVLMYYLIKRIKEGRAHKHKVRRRYRPRDDDENGA